MLSKRNRITKDFQYQHVRKAGGTIRTPVFLLNYVKSEEVISRFGFITTKKLGNAVERNRAARIMREAVRLLLDEIAPGYDMVFVLHRRIIGK